MLALHSELVKKCVAPVRTPTPADAAILPFGVVMLAILANIQQGVDIIVRPGLCSGTDMGRHGFRVVDRPLNKRRTSPAVGVDNAIFWRVYRSAAYCTKPRLLFVRKLEFTFHR